MYPANHQRNIYGTHLLQTPYSPSTQYVGTLDFSTDAPTGKPTTAPTGIPTVAPTPAPTGTPTTSPTGSPTVILDCPVVKFATKVNRKYNVGKSMSYSLRVRNVGQTAQLDGLVVFQLPNGTRVGGYKGPDKNAQEPNIDASERVISWPAKLTPGNTYDYNVKIVVDAIKPPPILKASYYPLGNRQPNPYFGCFETATTNLRTKKTTYSSNNGYPGPNPGGRKHNKTANHF